MSSPESESALEPDDVNGDDETAEETAEETASESAEADPPS